MAERAGCETSVLEVTGSKPIHSEVLLIRDLFLSFLISFYKAAFLSCYRKYLRSAAASLCACSFFSLCDFKCLKEVILISNFLLSRKTDLTISIFHIVIPRNGLKVCHEYCSSAFLDKIYVIKTTQDSKAKCIVTNLHGDLIRCILLKGIQYCLVFTSKVS